MMSTMTIRDLFERVDELNWSDFIYRPPGSLTLGSPCVVHDPDDVSPGDELPEEVSRLGYVEAVGIDDLRSIRDNARMQGRVPTEDELLEAFTYYLENDAFMSFHTKG